MSIFYLIKRSIPLGFKNRINRFIRRNPLLFRAVKKIRGTYGTSLSINLVEVKKIENQFEECNWVNVIDLCDKYVNDHSESKNISTRIYIMNSIANIKEGNVKLAEEVLTKSLNSIPRINKSYEKIIDEKERKIAKLEAEIRKFQLYRYGSLTAGRKDWEAKWDKSKGKRVLMYALLDYAGSFYRWADAINRYTDYAVRLVAFMDHRYSYDYDLLFPFPGYFEESDINNIIQEADIIHIKDETGFYNNKNGLPPDMFDKFDGPIVYTAYGSHFRHNAQEKDFQKYVLSFDARVAMTADLNHEWFKGTYVPQAIDTDFFTYEWKDGQTLAHSPSSYEIKGTSDLEEALKGTQINFDLITDVTYKECLERKKKATIFFDQASKFMFNGTQTIVGWYGNAALESAVFGIPTIAHISENAIDGLHRSGKSIDNWEIINTGLGSEEINKTLMWFFNLSSDDRQDLSLKTRKWVEDYHGMQPVAKELVDVYARVLNS